MPKWVKVVLIAVGTLFVLLVAAGFFGAMALKRTVNDVQQAAENAKVDGEVFGMTSTVEECVEETVNRSSDCTGFSPTCVPPLSTFLWSCAEEASAGKAFCSGLPRMMSDEDMVNWGRSTCTQHGQPNNEMCAIALATITGYCQAQTQMR
jgi:hypothetical protein